MIFTVFLVTSLLLGPSSSAATVTARPCPGPLTRASARTAVDAQFDAFFAEYERNKRWFGGNLPAVVAHDRFEVTPGREVVDALTAYVGSPRFTALSFGESGTMKPLNVWSGRVGPNGFRARIWKRNLFARVSIPGASQSVGLGPGLPMFAVSPKPRVQVYDGFGSLRRLLARAGGTVYVMEVGGTLGFSIAERFLPSDWRRRFSAQIAAAYSQYWAVENETLEVVAGPSVQTTELLERLRNAGRKTIPIWESALWSVLFHVQDDGTVNVLRTHLGEMRERKVAIVEALALDAGHASTRSTKWTVLVHQPGQPVSFVRPVNRR